MCRAFTLTLRKSSQKWFGHHPQIVFVIVKSSAQLSAGPKRWVSSLVPLGSQPSGLYDRPVNFDFISWHRMWEHATHRRLKCFLKFFFQALADDFGRPSLGQGKLNNLGLTSSPSQWPSNHDQHAMNSSNNTCARRAPPLGSFPHLALWPSLNKEPPHGIKVHAPMDIEPRPSEIV